jgi:hypothetical protein
VFTARYVLHSSFCQHSVFMCFVWVLEQTAIIIAVCFQIQSMLYSEIIIFLYSIDCLVLITETECVCCAVVAVSSDAIQFNP